MSRFHRSRQSSVRLFQRFIDRQRFFFVAVFLFSSSSGSFCTTSLIRTATTTAGTVAAAHFQFNDRCFFGISSSIFIRFWIHGISFSIVFVVVFRMIVFGWSSTFYSWWRRCSFTVVIGVGRWIWSSSTTFSSFLFDNFFFVFWCITTTFITIVIYFYTGTCTKIKLM